MLRTTVVGSWPIDAPFNEAMTAYHAGTYPAAHAETLLTEVARTAIAQQRACGLDEITGGETSADTFILQFPKYLTGIAPTADQVAWGGRGTYAVTGPLHAPQGLGIAAAYRREKAIDPAIGKVTIPGPSEITMMLETESDAQRPALWEQAIALIRTEIQECVALGATDIQLDLPHIAMGLVDNHPLWTTSQAVAIAQAIFAGFSNIRRSVHLCYGDFQAQTWTENRAFQPLLPTIQGLAGCVDRVVLEFSLPEQWADRELLAEIPPGMEIAAGIVDVKSPQIETVTKLETKIEELLNYVPAARLLIAPSCGFGRRDTDLAIRKSQAMTRAVHKMNAGG
ncbi:MAG: hypothetical protein WDZ49_17265 [Litorilinea sp.]